MTTWKIDPDHSVAAFGVTHLMIAKVRGQFNKVEGTIEFDPGRVSASSIAMTIDPASIVTGIAKRDAHLRSADFLDVERYPAITFRSTQAEPAGEGRGRVTGELTLHGVTRTVTLDVSYKGPVTSPFGGEVTMGFSAQVLLNRDDYGILWNEVMDNGGLMIAKEIELSIDLEADRVDG